MTKIKRLCCHFVFESEGKRVERERERDRQRAIVIVKVGRLKT